jgi:tRNA A37 threonylcarbamoyladenosine dehydratase
MLEEFSRTGLLIGSDALKKIAGAKVAVFGIGGVGSFAVEGLARCGLGHFVLVDDDHICLTNINRQIHASHLTLGQAKVEVLKKRILEINPAAEVVTHQRFYLPESGQDMFQDDYDYIIDAVDTVTAKIDLVIRARVANIPIISAMGTGNKLDPTRFEVADIYQTSVCPLARVMRQELRRRGIPGLKVVYSREEPIRPITDSEDNPPSGDLPQPPTRHHGCLRRQIPGSISFVPSVAGLILAGEVIKSIGGVNPPYSS